MKRATDAFTWGALEEDDYRRQLDNVRTQLARSEQVPEERRILEATRLAQDIPAPWEAASPQKRKRMVWTIFSRIRISGGRIVSVRPRPETAPLFAIATLQPRSRPGSKPEYRTFGGIVIEGIEDLAAIADGVA